MTTELGISIYHALDELGISQRQFAQDCGIGRTRLSQIINAPLENRKSMPTPEMLGKIVNTLARHSPEQAEIVARAALQDYLSRADISPEITRKIHLTPLLAFFLLFV